MSLLFIDTSAFIAVADEDDSHHRRAMDYQVTLKTARPKMFTTNFIFSEAYTWLRKKYELRKFISETIISNPLIGYVYITEKQERQALELGMLMKDKNFSFTDLTSFVVMEELGIRDVFTFDMDFRRYGKFITVP